MLGENDGNTKLTVDLAEQSKKVGRGNGIEL